MNQETTQPEAAPQEVDNKREKLGLLDNQSLSDLIKANFLDENQEPEPKAKEGEEVASDEAPSNEVVEDAEDTTEDQGSLTKGVQKRINKLISAKKSLESELEAQKAELLNLKRDLDIAKTASQKTPEISNAVNALESVDQVKAEFDKAIEVILWCEENPDGGEIQLPDGTTHEVSLSEVRKMKDRKSTRLNSSH